MKAIYALLLCLAVPSAVFSQTEVPEEHVPTVVDCRLCHLSGSPTKQCWTALQTTFVSCSAARQWKLQERVVNVDIQRR